MTGTLPDPAASDAEFTPERLNAMSMDERVSEPMRAFSSRRHDDGAAHVTWWLWRTQERNRLTPLKPSQGSMFFLDCGRGAFAVTADHVYDGFLEDRDEHRIRSCQIGNVAFDDPEDRLIARGKHLGIDIATFRVTPEQIAATGKRIVEGTDGAWPVPPNDGEAVFFGGFPGGERIPLTAHEMSFGLHSAMVPLTSHTDYQLCCQLDQDSRVDVRGVGLPPESYDLGGVSGGPMLQPIYRDGIWGWRLVGVLSEAVAAGSFERVTAVRAHFILPDGQIGR